MPNIGKCILSDNEIKEILNINKDNANKIIEIAERLAKEYEQISASKFREFYDYVLKIDEKDDNWYMKLVLLKPKLAYTYGKETNRNKKEALEKLTGTFSKIIDEINQDINKFKSFKTFFEAVVAYHKIYAKSQ
ncbi:type III-A CRISPR-associated protein Csm2 [Methanocaldococcus indicus]|uniref:type III-A CRISPR-associated protein Csm2 n=1 Tax=Methanocaldococcus indicus TaxID=213231 RepID=UPI003C6D6156